MFRWAIILAALSVGLELGIVTRARAQSFRVGMSVAKVADEARKAGLELRVLSNSGSGISDGTSYSIWRRQTDGTYKYEGYVGFCKGLLFSRGWDLTGGFDAFTRTGLDLNRQYGPAIVDFKSEYMPLGLYSYVNMKWIRQDRVEENLFMQQITAGNAPNVITVGRSFNDHTIMCR